MDVKWLKKSYELASCNPPCLGGAEPRLFGEATVWAGRRSSIGLLLRSGERDGAEPDADAFDRRAIHKASRVRGAADDTLAEG